MPSLAPGFPLPCGQGSVPGAPRGCQARCLGCDFLFWELQRNERDGENEREGRTERHLREKWE